MPKLQLQVNCTIRPGAAPPLGRNLGKRVNYVIFFNEL